MLLDEAGTIAVRIGYPLRGNKYDPFVRVNTYFRKNAIGAEMVTDQRLESMMATASIPMPGMTLRLMITKPRGYHFRMALLTWLLWLAGRVAPSCIDVQTEITLST